MLAMEMAEDPSLRLDSTIEFCQRDFAAVISWATDMPTAGDVLMHLPGSIRITTQADANASRARVADDQVWPIGGEGGPSASDVSLSKIISTIGIAALRAVDVISAAQEANHTSGKTPRCAPCLIKQTTTAPVPSKAGRVLTGQEGMVIMIATHRVDRDRELRHIHRQQRAGETQVANLERCDHRVIPGCAGYHPGQASQIPVHITDQDNTHA
jgi:hypothetical protein